MLAAGIVLLFIAALILAGLVYQWAGRRRDAARYPAPGRLIDIGGGRVLHLHVSGAGSPVVVLEAGIGATSLSWAHVHPEIARFTTVCSYDRAGLGWSGPAKTPRTPTVIATELRELLTRAQLQPPFLLVGHSFGGLVVQRFAVLYRAETCGLVLVDPLAAAEWHPVTDLHRRMLARGIGLSRRGGTLARAGIVRACVSLVVSGRRIAPRLAGRVASGSGGSGFMDRMAREIGKLPPDVWPVVASHWSRPECFEGMVRHLEALPESAAEMANMAPLDVPAVVITGARNGAGVDPAPALPGAKRVIAHESGHWVQFDEPRLVVDAVRELARR
jgi:pimeloyl-ACP methyl ester carboxylesterase